MNTVNHSPFTLNDIAWTFSTKFHTDTEEFNQVVTAYQMKAHNQLINLELGNHIFYEGTDQNPQLIEGSTCYIACGN